MSLPEKREEESPVPPVAGERTWTIRKVMNPSPSWPWNLSIEGPEVGRVEVVELSRLRAAEEERERLAEALREGIPFVQQATIAVDKAAGVSSTPLTRWLEDWLDRCEALASLEQKED